MEVLGEVLGRLGRWATETPMDAVQRVWGRPSRSFLEDLDNDDPFAFLELRPGDEDTVADVAHALALGGAAPTLRTALDELFPRAPSRTLPSAPTARCRCRACRARAAASGASGCASSLSPTGPFALHSTTAMPPPPPPPPVRAPPPPPPPPATLYHKHFKSPSVSLAAAAAGLRDAGARDKAKGAKGNAASALSLADVQGGLLRLRKTGRITPHGGVHCPPQTRQAASPQQLIQTALLRKFHVLFFSSHLSSSLFSTEITFFCSLCGCSLPERPAEPRRQRKQPGLWFCCTDAPLCRTSTKHCPCGRSCW